MSKSLNAPCGARCSLSLHHARPVQQDRLVLMRLLALGAF